MKLRFLSLLLGASLSLAGFSARAEVTTTLTPSFVSQYMFRGVRLGGPSFQPTVEVASGNLGVGVWSNFPMKDKVVGVSDPEVGPYLYYTFTVNDSLSVVPGVTWYNYPDADSSAGFYKTSFEPYVAVNYTINGYKFTPKFYYDVVLDGPTFELTASYSVPMPEIKSSLDFAATVGTYSWADSVKDSSPKVKNTGDYYQIGVSAPFEITKSSKLIIGLAYTEGLENEFKSAGVITENSMACGRGVVTLTYTASF